MEPVTADFIFFIIFIRDRVHIRFSRHGGVERRVKHDDLRHFPAEHVDARPDCLHMRLIMERRERNQAFNSLNYLVVHQNALAEQRAALNDTVADSADFLQIFDNAYLRIRKRVLYLHERRRVVRHGNLNLPTPSVGRFMPD